MDISDLNHGKSLLVSDWILLPLVIVASISSVSSINKLIKQ